MCRRCYLFPFSYSEIRVFLLLLLFIIQSLLTFYYLKADLKEKLGTIYDVRDLQRIFVFQFRTHFGGGKSSGFGLIYDNIESAKKFEPKYRLIRVR